MYKCILYADIMSPLYATLTFIDVCVFISLTIKILTKIKYFILFLYDNMLLFIQYIRKGLVKNNSQ